MIDQWDHWDLQVREWDLIGLLCFWINFISFTKWNFPAFRKKRKIEQTIWNNRYGIIENDVINVCFGNVIRWDAILWLFLLANYFILVNVCGCMCVCIRLSICLSACACSCVYINYVFGQKALKFTSKFK